MRGSWGGVIGLALAATGAAAAAQAQSRPVVHVSVSTAGDLLAGYKYDGVTLVAFESRLEPRSGRPYWISRIAGREGAALTELHWDPALGVGIGWMGGVEIVPVPDWQYGSAEDHAMRSVMETPEALLLLDLPRELLALGVDPDGTAFRLLDANLLAYKAVVPHGSGGCGDGVEGAGATDVRRQCGIEGGEVQEPRPCSQCSSHASCQSAGIATPGNGCLGQCGLGCGPTGECSGACRDHDCCVRQCGKGPCPGRFIIAAFSKMF